MAGNPNKIGRKNPTYQVGRRRHTTVPGYHSILPRVFPYRYRCDLAAAHQAIDVLIAVERDGFAVTSHPATIDGHVHLWLSEGNAEYLVETVGLIRAESLEAIE